MIFCLPALIHRDAHHLIFLLPFFLLPFSVSTLSPPLAGGPGHAPVFDWVPGNVISQHWLRTSDEEDDDASVSTPWSAKTFQMWVKLTDIHMLSHTIIGYSAYDTVPLYENANEIYYAIESDYVTMARATSYAVLKPDQSHQVRKGHKGWEERGRKLLQKHTLHLLVHLVHTCVWFVHTCVCLWLVHTCLWRTSGTLLLTQLHRVAALVSGLVRRSIFNDDEISVRTIRRRYALGQQNSLCSRNV